MKVLGVCSTGSAPRGYLAHGARAHMFLIHVFYTATLNTFNYANLSFDQLATCSYSQGLIMRCKVLSNWIDLSSLSSSYY